jgi:hypothetical protein
LPIFFPRFSFFVHFDDLQNRANALAVSPSAQVPAIEPVTMAAPRQQLSMLAFLGAATPGAGNPAQEEGAQKRVQAQMQAGERGSAAARTGALAGKSNNRKKNTATSLDETRISNARRESEEDITLSDDEEEPDSVQNSEDENFISDGEHDTSGTEQHAMDASMAYEVGDDAEQYAEAIECVAGRKKRSNSTNRNLEAPKCDKNMSKDRNPACGGGQATAQAGHRRASRLDSHTQTCLTPGHPNRTQG